MCLKYIYFITIYICTNIQVKSLSNFFNFLNKEYLHKISRAFMLKYCDKLNITVIQYGDPPPNPKGGRGVKMSYS